MLVIRTGLPGHSKTLNSIKEIDVEASGSGRTVYYHNIPDLAVDKLKGTWYEFSEPQEWFNLPHNSIIVIDEAQGWFAPVDARKAKPPHLEEFETHRHKGFDVHLITQHGMFLDSHVRRLAGKHIYYWRLFNGSRVSRYEFEKFTDTDKQSELKVGKKSIIKIDKSFFGLYKSAVAHNAKFRPPLVFFTLPLLLIGLICLCYWYLNKSPSSPTQPIVLDEKPAHQSIKTPSKLLVDASVYYPRVEGLPYSAPIYDSLTTPSVAPKLTCFYSEDQEYNRRNPAGYQVAVVFGSTVACGCFTQQGTKQDVPFELCRSYAINGSFDNTISSPGRQSLIPGARK